MIVRDSLPIEQLKAAVEAQHGGTAALTQTVPVHEAFNG